MGNPLYKTRCVTALAVSLLCVVLQSAASAGVAVIGNPGLSVDSIPAQQVADIFLGKLTKLGDGTPIVVIDHQDSDVRDEFYSKVVGKSGTQLKAYWAKLVFTGEAVPPKQYPDDKAVIKQVAATAGAIGYVSDGSVDKSVKVLFKAN